MSTNTQKEVIWPQRTFLSLSTNSFFIHDIWNGKAVKISHDTPEHWKLGLPEQEEEANKKKMQQTLVQNPLAAQRLENDAFVSSFSGHFKAALRIAEETSNVPEEGAINKVMALLMKKKEKLTPEQVLSRLVRDRKARGKDSFNPVGSEKNCFGGATPVAAYTWKRGAAAASFRKNELVARLKGVRKQDKGESERQEKKKLKALSLVQKIKESPRQPRKRSTTFFETIWTEPCPISSSMDPKNIAKARAKCLAWLN
ncbi:uncharacterized protein LOC136029505 [Artemia franciscana]|uniref:uncharacterized protein LOC136029505 n=1 Tax=Artemia franciscana TaxID=6661 RepID=UPI0032DB0641